MGKTKVILRADGSPTIGMGHFTRTLALAEMLKDDFYLTYATRQPTSYQISEINRICNEVFPLPEDDSHIELFLRHLQGHEIVVLDNYYFTTEYQRKIKDKGCKLVCIDDMHDKHYVADVVINHAEGINESMFSKENYTQLLLGFRHVLLRAPFLQAHTPSLEKKIDLLVGIGGADPKDITAKMVSEILKLDLNLRLAVLVGNAYQGEINRNQYPNVEVFKKLDAKQVAGLMRSCSAGLFPASSIAIEAIAMRLPFLAGYFVDNQKHFYNSLISSDLAKPLDNFQNIDFKSLKSTLAQLMNNLPIYIYKYKDLIDLKSPNRIIETFKKFEYEK